MSPDDIGARLRQERKARRWTLREVHERTGLSISHVSNAERGHHAGPDTLACLAELYGLRYEQHTSLRAKDSPSRLMPIPSSVASIIDELLAAPLEEQETLADILRISLQMPDDLREVLRDQAQVMSTRLGGTDRRSARSDK